MKFFFFVLFFPCIILGQSTFDDVEQMLEAKQFAKAEIAMVGYVTSHPKDLKAIELLGDTYAHQLKWDNANTSYKKLVDANDDDANYQYKYGASLGMMALKVNKFRALGMLGDIKDAFFKAAASDPNHIDVRWALVEMYIQLPGIVGGSVNKSLKYAEELEGISKVDGYLAKGYIYEYDDEPELAEKYYKMAIKEGGSMTCYGKLTSLYEKQNEPQKAIANIEQNHDAHQRNALHYQIGKVAAEYNIELDKGEKCLHTYIKNYSAEDGVPLEWAYYRLAQIYRYQGKKTEALKYINMAQKGRPHIEVFVDEKDEIDNLQ